MSEVKLIYLRPPDFKQEWADILKTTIPFSTCAKRQVAGLFFSKEEDLLAVVANDCLPNNGECPRKGFLLGENYEPCKFPDGRPQHVEDKLVKRVQELYAEDIWRGGFIVMWGHYEPCASVCIPSMTEAGVEKIIFNEENAAEIRQLYESLSASRKNRASSN